MVAWAALMPPDCPPPSTSGARLHHRNEPVTSPSTLATVPFTPATIPLTAATVWKHLSTPPNEGATVLDEAHPTSLGRARGPSVRPVAIASYSPLTPSPVPSRSPQQAPRDILQGTHLAQTIEHGDAATPFHRYATITMHPTRVSVSSTTPPPGARHLSRARSDHGAVQPPTRNDRLARRTTLPPTPHELHDSPRSLHLTRRSGHGDEPPHHQSVNAP